MSAPPEDSKATEQQAPPSPAPSNPAAEGTNGTAETPAATESKAEDSTSAPTAEDSKPAENNTAAASAPKSSRTSARTKPSSSAATPVAEEKEKPAPKAKPVAKPRTSVPAGGSKKAGASGDKDKEQKGYSIGDIVLARLKGYPPWPARVANPDDLPRKVAEQRPSKNPSIFCVQFFPVGDYAWLNTRDINHLSSSDISGYLSQNHRKATGGLREAYQTAQDPTEWDEGQSLIMQQQQEDDGEEEVDELEDEDEEQTGGKRKKGTNTKGGAAKKAKTEKDDTKSKSKTKAEPKPKTAKTKATKAPVSQPAVENQAAADDDPMANDPECIKVKDWRHKLQRAFLGKGLPGADEMPTYDDLFSSIENYKGMTIEALQYSKIGKVMKKITAMTTIPRNDEFKITDRAQKLMTEWSNFIDQKESGGDKNGEKAAANGDDA